MTSWWCCGFLILCYACYYTKPQHKDAVSINFCGFFHFPFCLLSFLHSSIAIFSIIVQSIPKSWVGCFQCCVFIPPTEQLEESEEKLKVSRSRIDTLRSEYVIVVAYLNNQLFAFLLITFRSSTRPMFIDPCSNIYHCDLIRGCFTSIR